MNLRRVFLLCAMSGAMSTTGGQELDVLVEGGIRFSSHRLKQTAEALKDTALLPRSTLPDGSWKLVPPNEWTSGFFPGCLWLGFELTGDTAFLAPARRWTTKLESQKFNTRTHDVGFIMMCSFGNGLRLTSDTSYRPVLRTAAQSLASRFNATVGCIKSWDRRKWPFPVIIDNMMNLELLFWAAKNGGSRELYDIAVRHAVTTMEHHLRPDGSTYHVVSYDSATGAVLARETHQGYAHESVWARGQAWAIYGFTMAHRETGDRRFLETAQRAADWFLAHLPEDRVPFWDFNVAGNAGEPRDASAAAIAASALFELAGAVEPAGSREKYASAAREIVRNLCRAPYLSEGTASMGVLNHATGNKPSGGEIDVSLIYADYYFLEALVRLRRTGGW